jgi:hypothetical protein
LLARQPLGFCSVRVPAWFWLPAGEQCSKQQGGQARGVGRGRLSSSGSKAYEHALCGLMYDTSTQGQGFAVCLSSRHVSRSMLLGVNCRLRSTP